MMKWLPLPGHSRWRERASAFADGELRARDRERFAAHLGRCAECAAFVDDLRLLKAAVASLPTVEAPRSFRLTPAMVAQPAAVSRDRHEPRPLVVARRASQFASVAAVVALGVVAVTALDFGSATGGDDGGAATLASRDAEPKAAEAETADRNMSASPVPTKALPDFSGSNVGGSGLSATAAAPSPPPVSAQDTAANSGGLPGSPSQGDDGTGAMSNSVGQESTGEPGWRLTAAVTLAAVAVIAGASAWALRRRDS